MQSIISAVFWYLVKRLLGIIMQLLSQIKSVTALATPYLALPSSNVGYAVTALQVSHNYFHILLLKVLDGRSNALIADSDMLMNFFIVHHICLFHLLDCIMKYEIAPLLQRQSQGQWFSYHMNSLFSNIPPPHARSIYNLLLTAFYKLLSFYYILQVFITSASLLDDPNSSAPYSKFSHEKAASIPVSGRTAMLLIYVPSSLFLLSYLLPFYQAFSAGELTGTLLNLTNVTGNKITLVTAMRCRWIHPPAPHISPC